MIQIRFGAFETNSSSTNSISICMLDDYQRWRSGELYLLMSGAVNYTSNSVRDVIQQKDAKLFVTRDELLEMASKELNKSKEEISTQDAIFEVHAYPFKDFEDIFGGEFFEREFTTPSGEKVIAFGSWDFEH